MIDKNYHLMRTIYRTDATAGEPEYIGSFSDTVPLMSGATIISADWSIRGWVEVTFLVPGNHDGGGDVPYPAPTKEN